MLDNQSFQSLLQLAVAMNVGFAALATIYGNSIAKELRSTESLYETTRTYRDEAVRSGKYGPREREVFKNALELRSDVMTENSNFEAFLFGPARLVALLSAFLAYALLFIATFFGQEPLSPIVLYGSLAVNGTFLGCVGYAYIRSVIFAAPFRKRRRILDNEVSQGLLSLMKRVNSEENLADPSEGAAAT